MTSSGEILHLGERSASGKVLHTMTSRDDDETPGPTPLPLTSRLAIAAMRMKSAIRFSTPGPYPSRQAEIADMLQEAAERITALEAQLAARPFDPEIDP